MAKKSRRRGSNRRVRRYAGRAVSVGRSIGNYRGKFGAVLKRGLLGDTTSALGAGVVVSAVSDRVAPQFTPYATLAAEYAAGGVGGMVGAEAVKMFTGQQSILSGILGGFGLGGQPMAAPQGL